MAQDRLSAPSARLFKYHPVRFHVLRDDPLWIDTVYMAQEQIQEDRKWSLIGIAERLAFDHREQNLLFPEERLQFPIERVNSALLDEGEEGGGAGEANAEEMVFQEWHAGGEHIFDLSSISAVLADSDALNVPINSIKLPFEAFYIYWGAQAGLSSPSSGRFIDGCYVSRGLGKFFEDDGAFDLMFTTSISADYQWHKHSLLANLVIDAEGVIHCIGAYSDDKTIGGIGATLKDGDTYPENTARWKAHIPAALNMAANCLCYLAWDKSEIRSAYSSDAPQRLVAQAESKKETESRRAKGKLTSLGFRKIHLCGEALASAIGHASSKADLPPHWRRGHWRHQRYGEGWSEIKLIWINGIVVNSDKGTPDGKRIYVP